MLAASLGVAGPSQGPNLGRDIQRGLAGVYQGLSPAQIDFVSGFLNSTDPNPVKLHQDLLRPEAGAQPDQEATPTELLLRAKDEPLVAIARKPYLVEADSLAIATRLGMLHHVLAFQRIVFGRQLAPLEAASRRAMERLSPQSQAKLMAAIERTAKALAESEKSP